MEDSQISGLMPTVAPRDHDSDSSDSDRSQGSTKSLDPWKSFKKSWKKFWKKARIWKLLTIMFAVTTIVFLVLFIVSVTAWNSNDNGYSECAAISTRPSTGTCECEQTLCGDCVSTACTVATCNQLTGACSRTPRGCPDRNCTTAECVEPYGCVYSPIHCPAVYNNNTGLCECATDLCRNCVSTKCTDAQCNELTGQCTMASVACPPKNCTTVQCVEPEGCVYTPVGCEDGDACNPATNQCEYVTPNCTNVDTWECTDDVFLDGQCSSSPNNTKCDDNDKCTIDLCQPGAEGADAQGCVHTPTNPCALCPGGKEAVCELDVCICTTCDQVVDMVFVLDGSGSIGETNYGLVKDFAASIAAAFTNDPNFGLVLFSGSSAIKKELGACPPGTAVAANATEQECIQAVIKQLNYPKGSTNTPAALDDATKVLNGTGDRPGVPNVALVFTDGVPNFKPTKNGACYPTEEEAQITAAAASGLQSDSTVIGLGVAVPTTGLECCTAANNLTCNTNPLGVVQGIASPPVDLNYIAIESFSALDDVKNRIISLLCPTRR